MNPGPLTANEILALWSWIVLMGVSTLASLHNARKNAGLPLARVWYVMAGVCAWWVASAVAGLYRGPFVRLYRIGIIVAAVAALILYWRGDFRADR